MCGILGIINKFEKIDPEELSDALQTIVHRGPDDYGFYTNENVGLAHRRLSIVDLSSSGHQPMISEDENFIITYNGEIYNHYEIRRELHQVGYNFKGNCDTETLLYGYIHFGHSIVNKLNGIFSFAIYNKQNKQIFLARDQFGTKPLYYFISDNTFGFSSEIKALKFISDFDKAINYTALVSYINFLYSPGVDTAFKNVQKLLPGHYMLFDTLNFSFHIKRYFDIPFTGSNLKGTSEEDVINILEQKLISSVERQLMSDVPVGFFVSGGLDSSLIAAMAQRISGSKKINAFTINPGEGVKKEGFANDLDYAVTLSKRLGFDLNIINSKVDILADFDKMIWHLDEPEADPAPLSVYNISKEARRNGIKVLLGGTAADDLFSGYRRHQALYYNRWIDYVPLKMSSKIKAIIDKLDSNKPNNRRLKKVLRDVGKSDVERMAGLFSWIPLETNKSLFTKNIINEIADYNPSDYLIDVLSNIPDEKSELNKLLYLEMKGFLPDHNLNYTDKMSMAAGVETRVPYLDVDLVEFSTCIPATLKMKGATTKYILKKVAERYLPKDIIYRPKTGFGAPVREWIKNDMEDMINKRLSPQIIDKREIFDTSAVHKLINDNKSGKVDGSYTIFTLLAIESWMEQFVDN